MPCKFLKVSESWNRKLRKDSKRFLNRHIKIFYVNFNTYKRFVNLEFRDFNAKEHT